MYEPTQSGHGARMLVQTGPGTFVTIAQVTELTWPERSRAEEETTAHDELIDTYAMGAYMKRSAVTITLNKIFNNVSQDALETAFGNNAFTCFKLYGPGGSPGVDEWIGSGYIQAITQEVPNRTGVRTAKATIRLSGPMIVNGLGYGFA